MRRVSSYARGFFCVTVLLAMFGTAHAENPATKVFLNGVPTPVFFNDGDSFRILAGEYKGLRTRLAGFNTLESYGPVHQWGTWTAKELYFLAKKGTINARNGVWVCTSDLEKDGYGRLLWDCPDLIVDQVRKGYAHVMTVTSDPVEPRYLEAQREAIEGKRGIWAHGAPEYILTSTHSTSEEWGKGERPYNRVVSTRDGFSLKWFHEDLYHECDNVCFQDVRVDPKKVSELVAAMRAENADSEVLKLYSDDQLALMVSSWVRFDDAGELQDDAHREPLEALLEAYATEAHLGEISRSEPVCMVYVGFRRRYGNNKAQCLK